MKTCSLCAENKNCKFYNGTSNAIVTCKFENDDEQRMYRRLVADKCGFYRSGGFNVRPDLFVKRKGYWFYNSIHYCTYYIIEFCGWLQRKSYRFNTRKEK